MNIKPWRLVAFILLGFVLGFASGTYFYAKVLDKPDVVNETTIGKQKVKGHDNDTDYSNEVKPDITQDNSKNKSKKRGRSGRKKE